MNRSIIILGVFILILAGAIGIVFFLPATKPAPVQPTGVSTATLPTTPEPSIQSSKDAVKAALQSQVPAGAQITLGATAIAGDYALQVWGDTNTGGEALLKYDETKSQWTLVSWGGGAWGVSSLVAEGVPQDTATTLLAALPY